MCIMELKCHLDLVCLVCVLHTRSRWHFNSTIHILHTQDRDDTSTPQYTYYTHKIEMTLQLHNTHTTHTRSRWHVSSRSCVCSMCIVELKCHLDVVCVVCIFTCRVEVSSRSCGSRWHFNSIIHILHTQDRDDTSTLHVNTHTTHTRSRWHFISTIHILVYCGVEVLSRSCVCSMCIHV
jgi:hypothetical protein